MQFEFLIRNSSGLQKLREFGAKFADVVAKGVIDATTIMFQGSSRLLSEMIYNKSIPARRWRAVLAGRTPRPGASSNRPAWRRTSTLKRNERFQITGSGSRTQGSIENRTPYAAARHNLDKPSPYGYDNKAPWRKEAVKRYGDRSLAAMRAAIAASISQHNGTH